MVNTIVFVIRLHHYHGEDYCFCHYYYYYSLFFFFANEVYRTNTKPVQVWTPSGPKNTDPVSVTLTYFSRSQKHVCAKKPETSSPHNFVIYDRNLIKLSHSAVLEPCTLAKLNSP